MACENSTELVITNELGRQARFHNQHAQGAVHHWRWASNEADHVVVTSRHIAGGDLVHESTGETNLGMGGMGRLWWLLVGERNRHLKIAIGPANLLGELRSIKTVIQGSLAVVDVAGVCILVTILGGVIGI